MRAPGMLLGSLPMGSGARAATNLLAALATVLLGVLVGLLGSFHHASTLSVGGVRWPVGLVVSLAALVLAQVLARDALPLGIGPVLVLLAWVVAVATFGTSRPEGDLVVSSDGAGQTFLYGGFLLGVVVATVLALRGSGRRRGATAQDPERR